MNPTRYYLTIDTEPMNEFDDFGTGLGRPCSTLEEAIAEVKRFCETYPETIKHWDFDNSYLMDRQTGRTYDTKPDGTFWTRSFPPVEYVGGDDDDTTDFIKDLFRMQIIEQMPDRQAEYQALNKSLNEKISRSVLNRMKL